MSSINAIVACFLRIKCNDQIKKSCLIDGKRVPSAVFAAAEYWKVAEEAFALAEKSFARRNSVIFICS